MDTNSLGKHERFRTFVDHLEAVAIWIVTEPDTFDYISAGFEDIWGLSPEAVQNDVSRLVESIHPEDRGYVLSQIQKAEEELSDVSYESRIVRPDGEVRWVHTRQFVLRGSGGNVTEIVGISTDITEQKQRELEFAALNRILRHDIRNDMSIILAWAELLEDHVDDSGKEYFQKIFTAGNHIVELTEIAGEYAETVAGGEQIETKPVPLCSVLQQEVALRQESFPKAEFRFVGEAPDIEVMADEMLSSVFKNILNNAVQHNDKDVPVVEIDCDVRDQEVVVRIADNGPGISDDRRSVIFEEGEKGIESSGTGLGLHLVLALLDQYGGTIQVADNTPTGSVFTVFLPLADTSGVDWQ